jgi:hypothetical protein
LTGRKRSALDPGPFPDSWSLDQLGRARWAAFSPMSLSAHQRPTNREVLTSAAFLIKILFLFQKAILEMFLKWFKPLKNHN